MKRVLLTILVIGFCTLSFAGWMDSVADLGAQYTREIANIGSRAVDSAVDNVSRYYKEEVKPQVERSVNRVLETAEESINNVVDRAVDYAPELYNTVNNVVESVYDRTSEQLINDSYAVSQRLYSDGQKYWKYLDKYPIVKSAIQNTASYYTGGAIPGDDYLTMLIAKKALEYIDIPGVDNDDVMILMESTLALSNLSTRDDKEALGKMVTVLGEYSGLNSSEYDQVMAIYSDVFDYIEYDRWSASESEILVSTIYAIVEENPYKAAEILELAQYEISQADRRNTSTTEIIRKIETKPVYEYTTTQTSYTANSTTIMNDERTIISIIIISLAVLFALFGYKIITKLSWLWNFLFVSICVYQLIPMIIMTNEMTRLLIAIGIGAVTFFFKKRLSYVLIFIAGLGVGFLMFEGLFAFNSGISKELYWIFKIGIPVVVGLVAIKTFKFFAIFLTSAIGGWLIVKNLFILLEAQTTELSSQIFVNQMAFRSFSSFIVEKFQFAEEWLRNMIESIIQTFGLNTLSIPAPSSQLATAVIPLCVIFWMILCFAFVVLQFRGRELA